jgi:hypothetical protein
LRAEESQWQALPTANPQSTRVRQLLQNLPTKTKNNVDNQKPTLNLSELSIELHQSEAPEVFAKSSAEILQTGKRDFFAEFQPLNAIATPVHASCIPA